MLLYEKTKKTLQQLRMIQPVDNFEKEYNNSWNKIKLRISNDNNE